MENKEIMVACPTADSVREVLFNRNAKEQYPESMKRLHFERFVAGLNIKNAEEVAYLMKEYDAAVIRMKAKVEELELSVKREYTETTRFRENAANLDVQLKTLSARYRNADQNVANLNAACAKLQDENDRLTKQVKTLKAQLEKSKKPKKTEEVKNEVPDTK